MRNNFLNQNDLKPEKKQRSASKIIVKSNGKISLSKSIRPCQQENKKTQQINSLKKEIFKLKSQLEQEKNQNKKIAILSNEIRKVKEKLIQKAKESSAKKIDQIHFESVQKGNAFDTDLKETVKETISNQEMWTPKVSLMRDSTDQIFKNFSLIKSISKKSSNPQKDVSKNLQGNSKIVYLDEIQSMESREMIQSRLNERMLKFRSRQGSILEDKTVKYPNFRQKIQSQQTFFNEVQEYELSGNNLLRPQSQKFSVTNCINNKRNKNKQQSHQ